MQKAGARGSMFSHDDPATKYAMVPPRRPIPITCQYVLVPGGDLPAGLVAALKRVPGVYIWPNGWVVSGSSGMVVARKALEQSGIRVRKLFTRPFRGCRPYVPPISAEKIREALRKAEAEELRPGVWEGLRDHQRRGVVWGVLNGGGLYHVEPGGGKSRTSILWALLHPAAESKAGGAALVVTKPAVRAQFAEEVVEVTRLRPWFSDPSVRRRKGWEHLADYVTDCKTRGQRPFVIVGWPELPGLIWGEDEDRSPGLRDFPGVGKGLEGALLEQFGSMEAVLGAGVVELQEVPKVGPKKAAALAAAFASERVRRGSLAGALAGFSYDSLINDEIHDGGAKTAGTKRAEWVVAIDGSEERVLKHNASGAAEWLSRGALRRCATTGTPIPDRLRDLHGPWDLIQPGGMGGRSAFTTRYCNKHYNEMGYPDDSGSCFTTFGHEGYARELALRLSIIRFFVPYEESHGHLPPCSIETLLVPPSALETSGKVEREGGSGSGEGFGSEEERQTEYLLAQAARQKRPFAVDLAWDALRTGQKVILFGGRKKEVERVGEALRKRVEGMIPIWVVHGTLGDPTEARREYMKARGAGCLVATYDLMGTGTNLQDTDLLIVTMLPWRPDLLLQMVRRVHREGQTRPVRVVLLCAQDTIDMLIRPRVVGKVRSIGLATGSQGALDVGDALGNAGRDVVGEALEKYLDGVDWTGMNFDSETED